MVGLLMAQKVFVGTPILKISELPNLDKKKVRKMITDGTTPEDILKVFSQLIPQSIINSANARKRYVEKAEKTAKILQGPPASELDNAPAPGLPSPAPLGLSSLTLPPKCTKIEEESANSGDDSKDAEAGRFSLGGVAPPPVITSLRVGCDLINPLRAKQQALLDGVYKVDAGAWLPDCFCMHDGYYMVIWLDLSTVVRHPNNITYAFQVSVECHSLCITFCRPPLDESLCTEIAGHPVTIPTRHITLELCLPKDIVLQSILISQQYFRVIPGDFELSQIPEEARNFCQVVKGCMGMMFKITSGPQKDLIL